MLVVIVALRRTRRNLIGLYRRDITNVMFVCSFDIRVAIVSYSYRIRIVIVIVFVRRRVTR